MNNPNDICLCCHKRSKHKPDCRCFTLDPNAIASGHNPNRLTQVQVSIANGWRLLEKGEVNLKFQPKKILLQIWRSYGYWDNEHMLFGTDKRCTYRTRLTRAELRAARGLPAEPAPESEQTLEGGDEPCALTHQSVPVSPKGTQSQTVESMDSSTSNAAESEVQPADSGGKTLEQNIWRRDGYHGDNFLDLSFLRVGVAKACGWYLVDPPAEDGTVGFSLRHPTKTTIYPWWCTEERAWEDAPNYPASLDAMATAEATLEPFEWANYTMELRNIIMKECDTETHYIPGCERSQHIADFWFYHATALQRARAFLFVKEGASK